VDFIPLRQSVLVVTDVQCGFTELHPEELPVPGGLAIVPAINRLMELPWARIDATQDWHPPDHVSFQGREQNLYPPHCVMGTPGAEFLPGLDTHKFHTIWRKGFDRDHEAYAVTAQHPGLMEYYRAGGITTVVVCGLALNICCYYSARDFRNAGFKVILVEDASAGLDVPAANLLAGNTKKQGQQLGIDYLTVAEVLTRARWSNE
jgi:nicotinamidase/pyrazinamidase